MKQIQLAEGWVNFDDELTREALIVGGLIEDLPIDKGKPISCVLEKVLLTSKNSNTS